jgi:hypothetical protein
MKLTRKQAVASALGSVRAEGSDISSEAKLLLSAWARYEISTQELAAIRRLLAMGVSIKQLLVTTQCPVRHPHQRGHLRRSQPRGHPPQLHSQGG